MFGFPQIPSLPSAPVDLFRLRVGNELTGTHCLAVIADDIQYYVCDGMPFQGPWPADGHLQLSKEELPLLNKASSPVDYQRFHYLGDALCYARSRSFTEDAASTDFRLETSGKEPLSEVPEGKKLATISLGEVLDALHVDPRATTVTVGGFDKLDMDSPVDEAFTNNGYPYDLDLIVDFRGERYAAFFSPFAPLARSVIVTRVGDDGPCDLVADGKYASLVYRDLVACLDSEGALVLAGRRATAFIEDRGSLADHVVQTLGNADQKLLRELKRLLSPYERARAATEAARAFGMTGIDTSHIRR